MSELPAAIKTLANQSKHLTKEEIAARQEAESAVLPDRVADLATPPRGVTGSAATYWKRIVERLDGVDILDDLDREALGIYCQMLARRDRLNRLYEQLAAEASKADGKKTDDGTPRTPENIDKLNALAGQLASLERNIMAYADKLGFTPQSRARLAQKRAAAAEPDAAERDLFGD